MERSGAAVAVTFKDHMLGIKRSMSAPGGAAQQLNYTPTLMLRHEGIRKIASSDTPPHNTDPLPVPALQYYSTLYRQTVQLKYTPTLMLRHAGIRNIASSVTPSHNSDPLRVPAL